MEIPLEGADDGVGGFLERTDLAIRGGGQQGLAVSGVDVFEAARGRVEQSEEDGGEDVFGGGLDEVFVDVGHHVAEGGAVTGGDAEGGLEVGHDHGGGEALAGDIADGEGEAAIGEAPEVAVIAADPHDGFVIDGDIEAGGAAGVAAHEAGLDVAGEFELVVEDLALGLGLGEQEVFAGEVDLSSGGLDEVEHVVGCVFGGEVEVDAFDAGLGGGDGDANDSTGVLGIGDGDGDAGVGGLGVADDDGGLGGANAFEDAAGEVDAGGAGEGLAAEEAADAAGQDEGALGQGLAWAGELDGGGGSAGGLGEEAADHGVEAGHVGEFGEVVDEFVEVGEEASGEGLGGAGVHVLNLGGRGGIVDDLGDGVLEGIGLDGLVEVAGHGEGKGGDVDLLAGREGGGADCLAIDPGAVVAGEILDDPAGEGVLVDPGVAAGDVLAVEDDAAGGVAADDKALGVELDVVRITFEGDGQDGRRHNLVPSRTLGEARRVPRALPKGHYGGYWGKVQLLL